VNINKIVSDMVERINKIKEEKARSERDFALKVGVKPNTMNQYLSGERGVSLDVVLKILDTFPDISSDWLLFGKGEMHKSEVAFTGRESESELDLHAQLAKTEAELARTRDELAKAEAAVENMQELLGYHREKIADLTKQLVIAKKGRKIQRAV
jgi:transcriptional regulator with XRE-family HTH domain